MKENVDLCTSGLIIGRRRYELTGLKYLNHDTSQVTATKPIDSEGWEDPGFITPEMTARSVLPIGKLLGAGKPKSLVGGELNPDSPATREQPNNTCNILLSLLAIISPRSRVVLVGRIMRNKEDKSMPQTILVEPAQVSDPCVYVARALCDVFARDGLWFKRLQ
jgi:hypothetical protein